MPHNSTLTASLTSSSSSSYSSCNSDTCGWIAAIISCLAFGSFGVPIKSDAANSVNVDPLVFQSYKSFACFATCWVVLLMGQEFSYSPWGIISGLFWVPSGVAAVYAIRNAGLAVAQGTWSSLIVMVSFIWGIIIFDENVQSKLWATVAMAMMMMGLWGMSYFSSPDTAELVYDRVYDKQYSTANSTMLMADDEDWSDAVYDEELYTIDDDDDDEDEKMTEMTTTTTKSTTASSEGNKDNNGDDVVDEEISNMSAALNAYNETKRQWRRGLLAAVFNGIWGGSVLVPMHFANNDETSGLGYVISFAIGALLITILLWILRLLYTLPQHSFHLPTALSSLPSFHISILWKPGLLSGTIWSIGNMMSMISVDALGQGVGYSVVQASMLVSGLWGIFWLGEVKGVVRRMMWLMSAVVTVGGILFLGVEHERIRNEEGR